MEHTDTMPQSRTPFIVLIVVLIALIGLGVTLMLQTPKESLVVSSGAPDVGGPFSLLTHEGKRVTDTDFRGKPMLVFFGFTYCPDVCPLTLELVSSTLSILGADGADIQPLFVTVDPERDTPEVMADYIQHFGPRFVGLTGTPDEIAAVTSTYHVYAKKRPLEDPSGALNSDNYLVDHTNYIYLMGRDGAYLAHFSDMFTPDEIASQIRRKLTQ